MYADAKQGYMPDYKPESQATAQPSSDTPSGDGFLFCAYCGSDPMSCTGLCLKQRPVCMDCE
jgi:hypothetical protein